ncbi:hypothetical protein HFO84_35650 [Rhizobium leguminosarum]|uniref:hypothetical protein n=1 Tax=Rhizobium leguminosarum TaxID=384 RepID=UPI001C98789A|nr:hypothetical protein [Rhizobium leguminosarum]MBY5482608.1 hypothetical protein [Rhizobium leguminosarum]
MEEINNSYADQVIARTFENAARQPNDPDRIVQGAFKRADAPLIRRANILYKRAATNHLSVMVAEQEASETAPLRALLAETDDLAKKRRIQREIDGYRILNVQRPVPGLGNNLKTLPIANRALRRKMTHDVRRGMKHADLIGSYGRLALHVLSVDDFNPALAGRHELGLSKDVQFAGTAALVAEDAAVREAA